MITKEQWDVFNKGRKIKSKIEDHITESLKVILEIYGSKLAIWYYSGAKEGMGEMRIYFGEILIQVEMQENPYKEIYFVDECYNGYLNCSFPVHFLFLSTDEIKDKVSKFNTKMEKEEQLKVKKEKAKKSALKKLTKKEREALGLS